MSFLGRLLERHREDGPSSLDLLEPRLPSRFERVTRPETPLDLARDVAVEAPAPAEATPTSSARAWQPASGSQPAETGEARVSVVRGMLGAESGAITVPRPPAIGEAPPDLPLRRSVRSAAPSTTDPTEPAPPRAPAQPPLVAAIARARQDVLAPPASPSTVRTDRQRDPAAPVSEPTIHVTIGRVDVRAIVAATPGSSRPTPALPKRSLEDYLSRRDGAAR